MEWNHRKPDPAAGRTAPRLLLIAALVLVAAPPARAAAAPQAWKAVAVSGNVETRAGHAQEEGAWQRISRGDALMPGDSVRTGRRGRVTLTRQASIVILNPQSEVELTPGTTPSQTTVTQNRGKASYEVDSGQAPHFRVVTPYLVAGVKGTVFDVEVSRSSASVDVAHGVVQVTNNFGESRDVTSGERISQERDERSLELAEQRGRDGSGSGDKHGDRREVRKYRGREAVIGEDVSRDGVGDGSDRREPTIAILAGSDDAGRDRDERYDDDEDRDGKWADDESRDDMDGSFEGRLDGDFDDDHLADDESRDDWSEDDRQEDDADTRDRKGRGGADRVDPSDGN